MLYGRCNRRGSRPIVNKFIEEMVLWVVIASHYAFIAVLFGAAFCSLLLHRIHGTVINFTNSYEMFLKRYRRVNWSKIFLAIEDENDCRFSNVLFQFPHIIKIFMSNHTTNFGKYKRHDRVQWYGSFPDHFSRRMIEIDDTCRLEASLGLEDILCFGVEQ